MSMEFGEIHCDVCDFEAGTLINWGGFFYVFPDKYQIWVIRKLGWCYSCNTIQPIEFLPALNSQTDVVAYLKSELSKLTGRGIFRFLRRYVGKDKTEIAQLVEEIVKAERFVALIKNRKSPPKCLKCSGIETAYFDIPDFHKKTPQQIQFQHPGCDGQLWIEESSWRISLSLPSRYYTPEGEFICEDNKDHSLRDFFAARPKDHPLDTITQIYFG